MIEVSRRTQRMTRTTWRGRAVHATATRLGTSATRALLLASPAAMRSLCSPTSTITEQAVDLSTLEHALDRVAPLAGRGGEHGAGHIAPERLTRGLPDRDHHTVARLSEDAARNQNWLGAPSTGRAPGAASILRPAAVETGAGSRALMAAPAARHSPVGSPPAAAAAGRPFLPGRPSDAADGHPGGPVAPEGTPLTQDQKMPPGDVYVEDLRRPIRPRVAAGSSSRLPAARAEELAWAALEPSPTRGRFAAVAPEPAAFAELATRTAVEHGAFAGAPRAESVSVAGGLADLVSRWRRAEGELPGGDDSAALVPAAGLESGRARADSAVEHAFALDRGRGHVAEIEMTTVDHLADALDELLLREAEQHGLDGCW